MKKESKNTAKNQELIEQGIPQIALPRAEDYNGIIVDPFGSWTGVQVENPLEEPIQDVDDL